MITLEDYQESARDWLSTVKRGAVISPAASGKTIIAAAGLAHVLNSRVRDRLVKVGWMANTKEQIQQAKDAVEKFPEINRLAEVKYACAAAQTDWSDRDVLIIDEVHHILAPGWMEQAIRCKGAIWGFTATPPEDLESLEIFNKFFNHRIFTIERGSVKKRISTAHVTICHETDTYIGRIIDAKAISTMAWRSAWNKRQGIAMSEGELWSQVIWQACMKYGIVENKSRNLKVLELMQKHKNDPTLVLVNQINHGEAFAKKMPHARMCHSKMGAKKRRETLAGFLDGSVKCIIATSLADEGLNLPNAQVLILVSGGRSKAKTEQRTGRVLRIWKDKPGAVIYDFADKSHPLLAKHSRVRQELYRKLGYEVYGGTV